MKKARKVYLGDAVYVEYDGFGLVLTAEDGIRATNRIVLEPEVYGALLAYVESLAPAQSSVADVSEEVDE